MVDAVDVQEHMNGGTSVIPNLDSIQEFRVLTTNFDPEYGNYNGGLVNVVTKSGTNSFHGDAFEFLRNTDLNARNFFDSTHGAYRQNQFGGTIGGPVRQDRIFFFVDYQDTRNVEGITSAETQMPSTQDRTGNLSDMSSTLTGTVSGPYTASLLTHIWATPSPKPSVTIRPDAPAQRNACFATRSFPCLPGRLRR